ncbi:hypothetical protein TKK_0009406 [Trichogramma kaykai]|uniref:Structure-specific endonuclease subunit SLX4 n=1 Tax=Trichogramma kaykai TaxID=54128 RepID=A0ABD2WYT4_9HYME
MSSADKKSIKSKLQLKRHNSERIPSVVSASNKLDENNQAIFNRIESSIKEIPSKPFNDEDSLADFKSPKGEKEKKLNLDRNLTSPKKDKLSRQVDEDDSLADFKSPKDEKAYKPILDRFKIDAQKSKKKIFKSKTKSRKSLTDAKQPSIESSFFKPQPFSDAKESFPCPLCLKPFKDEVIRMSHLKNCATKNNITTKKALDAMQLQDRQASERRSLGLPAAPIVPEKKKVFRSKNYSTKDDPQLQLAMAISESLFEAEKAQFEEKAVLAGIPLECAKEISKEDLKTNLKKLGFSTDVKTKKKKLCGPTILQTRTKEDNDRVLTERIACIITGDDAYTQVHKNESIDIPEYIPPVLNRELLKNIEIKTDSGRLWDQTRLTKNNICFYVNNLKEQLFRKPLEKDNETEVVEIVPEELCIKNQQNNSLLDVSIVYEPVDFDLFMNQEIKKTELSEDLTMENSKNMDTVTDFMKDKIINWAQALNDSGASDIIIFVKNDKHIYAHKLVLYVQCSNILLDIETKTDNDQHTKGSINWSFVDQNSALAFLEFVYCGVIVKYKSIFDQSELLLEVQKLAKMYSVQQLFTYIKKKQKYIQSEKMSDIGDSATNESLLKNSFAERSGFAREKSSEKNKIQKSISGYHSDKINSKANTILEKHQESVIIPSIQNVNERRLTASPDLFASDNEESTFTFKTETAEGNRKNFITESVEKIKEEEGPSHSQETIINILDSPDESSQKSLDLCSEYQESVIPKKEKSSLDEIVANVSINELIAQEKNNSKQKSSELSPEDFVKSLITERRDSDESLLSDENDYNFCKSIFENTNSALDIKNEEVINSSPKKNEDLNESIYTAVTPPRDISTPTISTENIPQSRSDISEFIDKVKRKNARSIMDTDSEIDSPKVINRPQKIVNRPRNPFFKKNRDDSYAYLRKDGNPSPYHKVLSLLEKDVMQEKQTHTKSDKSTSKLNKPEFIQVSRKMSNISNNLTNCKANDQQIDDVICIPDDEDNEELETLNESDMSMYSKYKKNLDHDNSIANYRYHLKQSSESSSDAVRNLQVCADSTFSPVANTNEAKLNPLSLKKSSKKSNDVIADVTLVSDSDEDIDLKKLNHVDDTSIENTSKNCSSESIQDQDETISSKKYLMDNITHRRKPKILNSTTLPEHSKFSFVDIELSRVGIDSKKKKFKKYIYSQKNSSLTTNYDQSCDVSEEYNKLEEKVDKEMRALLEDFPNCDDLFNSSNNEMKDEALTSATVTQNHNNSLLINNSLRNENQNNELETLDFSPVSITTTPEDLIETAVLDNKVTRHKDQSIKSRSQNDGNKIQFETIDDECFDDIEILDSNGSRSINRSPKEIIEKTTLKGFDYSEEKLYAKYKVIEKCKEPELASLVKSPIISNPRKSRLSLSLNKSRKRQSESPEETSDIVKKFKSETTSIPRTENEFSSQPQRRLQKSSSFTAGTPQNKEDRISGKYGRAVTPPVNYSLLGTPELHKELNKFGLKPQRREKAKLLLKHIYQQTHYSLSNEEISTTKDKGETSSETDESSSTIPQKPDINKMSNCGKPKTNRNKKSKENENIAAEMGSDNSEITSADNFETINVAFRSLLSSDQDLYNKCLTYEPLALEPLHSKLKESGVKCKINSLKDYLDKYGITFQVQTGKHKSRTKKG